MPNDKIFKYRSKFAVTLTEILVTVVILAILASIAVPAYQASQKKIQDKEAIATLNLLATAENIYYSTHPRNCYYPVVDIISLFEEDATKDLTLINKNLGTQIPVSTNWDYCVYSRIDNPVVLKTNIIFAKSKSDGRVYRVLSGNGRFPDQPVKVSDWHGLCN